MRQRKPNRDRCEFEIEAKPATRDCTGLDRLVNFAMCILATFCCSFHRNARDSMHSFGVNTQRQSSEVRRLPDGVFEQLLEIVVTDKLAQLLATVRAMPRSLLRIV